MRFYCLMVLLCSTLLSFGQATPRITLSGKVVDIETREGLEYATITLHHATNDTIVAGTSTNKQGRFKLPFTAGTYTLKIQFLSFKTYELISKSFTANLNLGTIELQPDNQLDEVEVTAEKKLFETKFNKKIYNASRDIANTGGTALDVLNNTPSVRVDDEGTITARGGSTTVLIDGKPQFGLDNGIDILKSIPANSIDKVEIISRSAKYDAEGGPAILNIVTKKRMGLGTNGSVEVHGGIPDNHGFSSFINEDTDKMNLYSTISFHHQDRKKYTNILQPEFNYDANRVDKRQRNSFLFNLGSDFYLDEKSTLTASFLINSNNKNYRSEILEPDFNRNVTDHDDGSRIEAALGYRINLNENGHQLSFDVKYDNTDSDNDTRIDEIQNINSIFQKSTKDQKLDNLMTQVDYTLPIGEKSTIEMGYKGAFRFYENDFNVSEFDNNIGDFVTIGGLDNVVSYDEKVNAVYGLYNATHNKFTYSLGLRAEFSDIELDQTSNASGVNKQYTDLFPSATLGYELSDDSYLSINYSRSIERPSASQINPFISFVDERFQTVGNQDLNPYYVNYLEILYDHSFKKLSVVSSFFLNFAADNFLTVIQNTGQQTVDGQDIFRRIPINSGDQNIIGVDLDLTYRFSNNFRLNAYLSPYNQRIENTIDPLYNNENTTWYASGSALISLDSGLRINATHVYQSPITNGLTTLRTVNFTNLTVSQNLFKKQATLTFRANDIFSSKKFKYESFEASTLTFRDVRYENQFLLTFTYRFKQKRRSSKDRSRDINKDPLEDQQDKKL